MRQHYKNAYRKQLVSQNKTQINKQNKSQQWKINIMNRAR